MSEAVSLAVQYGLPTVLLFVMAIWYARQVQAWAAERTALLKRVDDESHARITDAKDAFLALRDMQAKVVDAVAKLSDVAETRELQRELIDAISKVTATMEERARPSGRLGGR